MAIASVPNTKPTIPEVTATEAVLYLGTDHCLSVEISKGSGGYPPQACHVVAINETIQNLARAARAVVNHAVKSDDDISFVAMSVEGIADAITLLSQLSDGVLSEVMRGTR